jgi:uncharacterized membrane protein YeaQ/YmgE (transglycosylase-associated protein family)
MNIPKNRSNHIVNLLRRGILGSVGTLVLTLACLASQSAVAADDTALGEKTKQAAQEAATTVQEAGNAVAADAGQLWQSIDAARLKNRTPDEIVAWVIMGVLVGALAGMMTSLRPTFSGKLGRLLLGLAGASIGGIAVRVVHVNFGWGPVLIRYEELAFAFVGAILLLVVARLVRSLAIKKPSAS